jgi:hypothetical protein
VVPQLWVIFGRRIPGPLSLGSPKLGLSVGSVSNDCVGVRKNLNVAILVIPALADDRPGLSRVPQDDAGINPFLVDYQSARNDPRSVVYQILWENVCGSLQNRLAEAIGLLNTVSRHGQVM